jgi:tRNA(Ile)-lysidine synthase TilS/MesJ
MKTTLSKYQNRHIEYVKNKVAKALMDYQLVSKGDRILAAVSGGKDSLVMLETLAAVQKFDFVDFELQALHIDVKDVPYAVDKDFLKDFCRNLGIKINFVSLEADIEDRGKKSPCFVCSWNRRKALFNFTKDNGFQKLALGHHLDDAVETLLINMAYHGNIASMPAKLSMFEETFQLIRPLILLTNKDTSEFANIRKYPPLKQSCPFEDTTKRTTARELIQQLENIHPKARLNLFRSMGNIDEAYLP